MQNICPHASIQLWCHIQEDNILYRNISQQISCYPIVISSRIKVSKVPLFQKQPDQV